MSNFINQSEFFFSILEYLISYSNPLKKSFFPVLVFFLYLHNYQFPVPFIPKKMNGSPLINTDIDKVILIVVSDWMALPLLSTTTHLFHKTTVVPPSLRLLHLTLIKQSLSRAVVKFYDLHMDQLTINLKPAELSSFELFMTLPVHIYWISEMHLKVFLRGEARDLLELREKFFFSNFEISDFLWILKNCWKWENQKNSDFLNFEVQVI